MATKRNIIIDLLNKNVDEEQIEKHCLKIGLKFEVAETVYLYLGNTIEDVADILNINTSTVQRRINRFIECTKNALLEK